jgi:uncharacterized protein (DUF934 family)
MPAQVAGAASTRLNVEYTPKMRLLSGKAKKMSEEAKFIVVADQGFAGEHIKSNTVLVLENIAEPKAVFALLEGVSRIDIGFPSFADGRGYSLAMNLRRGGYRGHLRAVGHIIADQYAHARRCGFDDIAISDADAARQPEHQWLEQVPHINATYQTRLQQGAIVA